MPTYKQIKGFSRQEVEQRFDNMAGNTPDQGYRYDFTAADYLNELHHREESEHTERIVALTEQMTALTGVITILTLVTTVATLWQIVKDSLVVGLMFAVVAIAGFTILGLWYRRRTLVPRTGNHTESKPPLDD